VRAVKTSRPTPKPTQVPSSLPSSVPSAEPTLSLASRWKDKFDGVRDSQFTGSNMLSLFDVEVNGIDVSSTTSVGNGCARWNSFLSFMATKQIGYYPAYITAIKFDSLDSTVARNVTCRTVAKSSQVTGLLATAFRSSGQAATAVTCSIDGSTVTGTWTVGSCGSRPYLRVASATTTLLQLSPCNSSCDVVSTGEKTGVIRGVGIALTANYPAPDIISVNVTSPSKTVISATVRTSGPGLAYCAAYPTSSFAAPSSPSAVIIAGVSAWTVGNVSRINVTSLRPYTEYTVLCGVSSQQGITTTVDTMVFKAISVWTPCCRTVSVAIKSKNSLLGSVVTNAVVVTVSSLPSSSLGLSFSLTKGTNSYSLLSPSTIAFSSKSAASANLALLTTTVSGDYNVTVTLTGVEQSAYEVVYVGGNKRIRVFDSTQEPTAPSLSSAVFSADGANISMAFDIATNFGQLGGSRFVCSKLFRFVGDDTSTCLWDAAGITVVVKPSYSSSLIVGSNISLRSEVIKAACPASLDCSSWSFSSTSTVFIASPTEPVAPVVVIGAPSVIGLCADLPLDISGSLGSGGRKWQAVNIRVDSPTLSNTTALESYFGRADVQRTLLTSLRLTVPSTHFESSSLFSISIQLCNFLGSCGLQQFVLTVSALSTPVSIMGASVRSQFTSQSLTLKALAYTASCDTGDSSSSQLLYSWSITSLSTSGALAISSVPTVSDTSLYFVRSFALQPLNSYDIVVTITSAQTKLSSSAAVTVSVLQGSLVASIAGGSYRSCRVGESIEVDGSASYDSDQANFGQAGLVFNWTSYQLLPSYSASCPILHSSSSGVTSWTVVGLANATNSTCTVALALGLGSRHATASALLYFVPVTTPVSVLSTSSASVSHVSASSPVTILASVGLQSAQVTCVWSVDSSAISLTSDIILTSATKLLPAASSSTTSGSMNLVFKPSSWPSGVQFTLFLTCSLGSKSSVNSIDVSTNGSPSPGLFNVTPTFGYSLVTKFALTADAWTDDGDYPLTYEFGYSSPVDGRYAVASSRSLTSSSTTILPSGLASADHAVECVLRVFDSLAAVSVEINFVQVNKTLYNSSALAAVLSDGVSNAGLDIDGLKQVVLATAVTVNTVSCTSAPNCTILHRQPCSSVANTCGSCMTNYVGNGGASNEPCVAITGAVFANQSDAELTCQHDNDCPNAWYSCELASLTCVSASKSCSGNCSGNGDCEYVNTASGLSVSTCLQSDMGCVAQCSCRSGYYGTVCDISASELAIKQDIRNELVSALTSVIYAESGTDSSTLQAWASGLATVTAAPSEMTSDAVLSSLALVSYVLDTCTTNGFNFNSSASDLLLALDNCMSFAEEGSSDDDSSRRSLLAQTASTFRATVDAVATASLGDMITGQDPTTVVQTNYRMNLQVVDDSSSSVSTETSVSVPLETAESKSGVSASRVSLTGAAGSNVALISLKSRLFSSSDAVSTLASGASSFGSYLANPMRLRVEGSNQCSSAGTSQLVTFKFRNAVSINASQLTAQPNKTYTTVCKLGVEEVATYPCPFGSNITHTCTGLTNYVETSRCANRGTVPLCVLTNGANCTVSAFTDEWTECSCSLCDFNVSRTAVSSRRRRLDSVNTYVGEVQSLTTYLAYDFESATMNVESLNAHDVKDAAIILSTFAFVWGLMAMTIVGIDFTGAGDAFDEMGRKLTVYLGYSEKERMGGVDPGQLSKKLAGKSGKSSAVVAAAPNDAMDLSSVTEDQAKDFIQAYVFTFFPNVYRDRPEALKFWYEIVHKHRYLSIFSKEKGLRKFVASLEVLTLLTAHMFLIAVLYDAQWPNDNGFCAAQTTQPSCLSQKSMFDSKKSLCSWHSVAESDAMSATTSTSTSSGGYCLFQSPEYNPVIQVALTMIVIAFSGPINAMISFIVKVIILSPTKEEVRERERTIRTRRSSAISAVSMVGGADTSQVDTAADVQQQERAHLGRMKKDKVIPFDSVALAESARSSHRLLDSLRRSSFRKTISESVARIPDVDESLVPYCMDDHKLRTTIVDLVNPRDKMLNTSSYLDYLSHVNMNITPDALLQEIRQLQTSIPSTSLTVPTGTRPRVYSAESLAAVQNADHQTTATFENVSPDLLGKELVTVKEEASVIINRLRALPQTMVGVKILELFVLDLLGRESAVAKLFANQRSAVGIKFVTSLWVKILAILVLVGFDIYFIIMCVAYGDLKGRKWQLNWMLSCLAYLFVDIFIKHVNIVFLVFYYIPELIQKDTKSVKRRLGAAIHNFVHNSFRARRINRSDSLGVNGNNARASSRTVRKRMTTALSLSARKFSVTDYLFVSAAVARAFPTLLESSIVLSYRSLSLSQHQLKRLQQQAATRTRAVAGGGEPNTTTYSSWWTTVKWNTIRSVATVTFINLLISLGCQNIVVQKIAVQTLDPLIMAVVALIGQLIIQSTMVGVPVVITILLLIALSIYWRTRMYVKRRRQLVVTNALTGRAVQADATAVPTAAVADQDSDIDNDPDEDADADQLDYEVEQEHQEFGDVQQSALNEPDNIDIGEEKDGDGGEDDCYHHDIIASPSQKKALFVEGVVDRNFGGISPHIELEIGPGSANNSAANSSRPDDFDDDEDDDFDEEDVGAHGIQLHMRHNDSFEIDIDKVGVAGRKPRLRSFGSSLASSSVLEANDNEDIDDAEEEDYDDFDVDSEDVYAYGNRSHLRDDSGFTATADSSSTSSSMDTFHSPAAARAPSQQLHVTSSSLSRHESKREQHDVDEEFDDSNDDNNDDDDFDDSDENE
jgi:hypothetical protein